MGKTRKSKNQKFKVNSFLKFLYSNKNSKTRKKLMEDLLIFGQCAYIVSEGKIIYYDVRRLDEVEYKNKDATTE